MLRQFLALLLIATTTIGICHSAQQNGRPTPALEELPYAGYEQRFIDRVEKAGALHPPTSRGKRIYGRATLEVWLKRDGTVEDVLVLKCTSDAVAKSAKALIRSLEPFEPLPSGTVSELAVIRRTFAYDKP